MCVQLTGPSQERVTGGRADSPRSDHALASQTGSVKVFVWYWVLILVGNSAAAVRIFAAVLTDIQVCHSQQHSRQQRFAAMIRVLKYVRTTILLCAIYVYTYNYVVS